ncbi:MAG: hypothetical protein RMJ28_07195 [Nitrososphaerota archaeon]|nr:hypothetical protein [Nitrososphaerota archaeon]
MATVLAALFIGGWMMLNATPQGDEEKDNQVLGRDEKNGLQLILDSTTVKRGVEALGYKVVNNRGDTVVLGEMYTVQHMVDGSWVTPEWMRERVFISIAYTLGPGESLSRVIELPEDIEPGRYRVIKEVIVERVGSPDEKIELVAYFTVEE